ncbi:MAG: RNB domain-containing ribonuclease, partial [Planctomycetes bacterium]|nr:RNB domain-containing ribonuclease [Planctomycetota bacterium]
IVEDVHRFLYSGHDSETVRFVEELRGAHLAREAAVPVLRAAGRVPWETDPFLVLSGVEVGFSPLVDRQAEELAAAAPEGIEGDPSRRDRTDLVTLSIDNPHTEEIDDALTFERIASGCRVGIHIADAAALVSPEGAIDEAARERGLTVYLPTGMTPMLPKTIGCELGSLVGGERRRAVSLFIDFDAAGELVGSQLERTWIRVDHRLDYDQVDEWFATGAGESATAVGAELRALRDLAQHLCRRRLEQGALSLDRRELELRVAHQGRRPKIECVVRHGGSDAHVLVREFMVLFNQRVAETASLNTLPWIYRGQDAPSQPWPSLPDGGYDVVTADGIFKTMKPSRSSSEPRPHSSLGVPTYTQCTSPLRRYIDLLLQRQLVAHLEGRSLPYGVDALRVAMERGDRIAKERAQLERESKRFWSLEYLQRTAKEAILEGVIVRKEYDDWLVELTESTIRGALPPPESADAADSAAEALPELGPGSRVRVRLAEVHPKSGRLRLRLVPTA